MGIEEAAWQILESCTALRDAEVLAPLLCVRVPASTLQGLTQQPRLIEHLSDLGVIDLPERLWGACVLRFACQDTD